ncbi:hypothetical protein [Sansalvadorimonas verongulae]|uniref:hypothetical protein n=1 Tax=Sansalvadorimonas verongulae TaxID=2172824 RepID=UPI0012BCC043|nr:hypothetical protein [Sansalvadorimonas verongulae]MTI15503.1 hypothetical protein [Sansalvadorimonas verongulae]
MSIHVNQSASPLIYPFSQPVALQEIALTLHIQGEINLSGRKQGEEGADDFLFRLGVVYEGDRRMGRFQRLMAPQWIKTLFALAPEGTGIDYISFYNVYSDHRLAGQERVHPASQLLKEHFVEPQTDDGHVTMKVSPESGKRVLGLWLSSDGDDTASEYSVQINSLVLSPE